MQVYFFGDELKQETFPIVTHKMEVSDCHEIFNKINIVYVVSLHYPSVSLPWGCWVSHWKAHSYWVTGQLSHWRMSYLTRMHLVKYGSVENLFVSTQWQLGDIWLWWVPLCLRLSVLQLDNWCLGSLWCHWRGWISRLKTNSIHQSHVSVQSPASAVRPENEYAMVVNTRRPYI